MEASRIGFLHLPGTAGSSLSDALARSLNCRYFPVHKISFGGCRNQETFDDYTLNIPAESPAREFILSYPLISGHLSVGTMQATYRTHMILVVADPKVRLLRLFAHHGSPEVSFSDWLRRKVDFQSDTFDFLAHGVHKSPNIPWSDLHAIGQRDPSHPTWTYGENLVAELTSPIDFIFFTHNPQFVIDTLHKEEVLPVHTDCKRLNTREPSRSLIWGDIDECLEALHHVTVNSYKLINQLASGAHIDQDFALLDDTEMRALLTEFKNQSSCGAN